MVNNVSYEKAMTGSEIARELGITRQAVSQALKRAMGKLYRGLRKENITQTPMETVLLMRDWLGAEDEDDIRDFFGLFPKDIQEEIKTDARTFTLETH